MQYTEILFRYFRSKYEAVLTSTHNVCVGSKVRNLGIALQTPVFHIKVGFKGYTFHEHVFLMNRLQLCSYAFIYVTSYLDG